MSNNEWFERGELPPVGSHIEVTFGNKSIWHECVILPSKRIAIDRYAGWHVMPWQDDFVFRPLKNERERAIDEMVTIALDCANFLKQKEHTIEQGQRAIMEAIYDKFIKKDEI